MDFISYTECASLIIKFGTYNVPHMYDFNKDVHLRGAVIFLVLESNGLENTTWNEEGTISYLTLCQNLTERMDNYNGRFCE